MYKLIYPVVLALFILSGCNSLELGSTGKEKKQSEQKATTEEIEKVEAEEEDLIKNLNSYETIVLEDNQDSHEIMIKYPQFGYPAIDEILEKEMNETLRVEKEQFEDTFQMELEMKMEGMQPIPYYLTREFEEPVVTDNFVSIYFEDIVFMGGANAHQRSYAFNYDLSNNQIITLDDLLRKYDISLDVISDLVAQQLMEDERFSHWREVFGEQAYRQAVEQETLPLRSNFSDFKMTEESITFYKTYYTLFSNAEGIVGVEFTWNDLEKYIQENDVEFELPPYVFGDSAIPASSLNYIDEEFGFTFSVPSSWENRYFIYETYVTAHHFAPVMPSKVLAFAMVENGKYMGDLFFLEVLEGVTEEEAQAFYEQASEFQGYATTGNGVSLAYGWIGQMPDPLYNEPYLEVGNRFATMVQDDLPKVLETIEFQ